MTKDRRKNSIKYTLWTFIIVLCFALIIALIIVLPQFYISKIDVIGTRELDKEEIIDNSGIEYEKHLFSYLSGDFRDYLSFRYVDIENKLINKYPYIKDAKVQVSFPYTVKINIEEHIEIAYVHLEKSYYAIDREGRVLNILDSVPHTRAPIIEGLQAKGIQTNNKLIEDEMRQVNRVLLTMNAILQSDKNSSDNNQLIGKIITYHPYQANTLYLTLKNHVGSTLKVKVNPSDNLQESIAWLRIAYYSGELDNLGDGILTINKYQKYFNKNETIPRYNDAKPEIQKSSRATNEDNNK